MRPRRRVPDWGLLLVFGFCLLAIWPFVIQPGLPYFTDADLWVLRAAQVTQVMHSGTLYTHWAPDFNFGLGSPLFNYLAPLPHYLSGLHQLITDANAVDSIRIVIALSIIAAGCGMFLFARQRWTPLTGILCALFYLFSPPIVFVLPHQAGDLAMLLSLGLLPWTLWAVDRFAARPTRSNFLIAASILVLWLLADARLTLIGIPLILIAALTSVRSKRGLWVLLVGMLLSAFFWFPALAERDSITWLPVMDDPRGGQINPDEIFGVPAPRDAMLLNPSTFRGVGWPLVAGALIGLAAVFSEAMRERSLPKNVGVAVYGVLLLIAALPFVAHFWINSAGWQIIAPYHLLIGGVLICFSLLAGQAARWLEQLRHIAWQSAALGMVCLLALAATAIPLYTSRWIRGAESLTEPLTEVSAHAPGSLRNGFLLPLTAYQPFKPLSTLALNTFRNSDPKRNEMSPNQGLLQIERTALASRYTANLEKSVSVRFDRFAFPGWYVSIDGVQNDAQATAEGLVSFNLPETAREVVVWFGSTGDRSAGWFISLAGVVLLLLLLRLFPTVSATGVRLAMLGRSHTIVAVVVLVFYALAGGALWLAAPILRPEMTAQINRLNVSFANTPIELAGYHFDSVQIEPGQTVESTFLWRARQSLTADYLLQVQLIGEADGQVAGETVQPMPGGIPTSAWLPGYLVQSAIQISMPATLLPGRYRIELSLEQCPAQQSVICDKPLPLQDKLAGQEASGISLPQTISVIAH